MRPGAAIDPVELEFFRQLFVSIPEEMGVVLRKTAFSANIKERRDYSCAVYGPGGETLAMGDHMPVHLGAMPMSVEFVRKSMTLHPGDVAIVNDPFQGGTHLPDITAVSPVYVKGTRGPAFFVAVRAHHSDVGGMSPGSMPLATEIYQEGLRLPPVKLVRKGQIDRDIMAVILANVRTPVEREGDLLAQLSAMNRGELRLREMTARYGLAKLRQASSALLDYSSRMMAHLIESLPDGRYEFEDHLDEASPGSAPVRVRAAITIRGPRATVDFTGSDAQVAGPVNANLAVTQAAVFYVFRCLLHEDVPASSGLMQPIEIVAPAGTVVNALPPAAMAAGNVEMSQRITDVLLGALAQAAPDRIPAASSGTMNNVTFGGWDPVRNRRFAWYETIAGGMGAAASAPGMSAVHTHMTNSWNTPAEAFEHDMPVRIRQYKVRRGSGGAGRNRGGDGIIREFEFLVPAEATILADRRISRPYPLDGGDPGAAGRTVHISRSGAETVLPGKVRLNLAAGDRLRIESPGGGGHGKTS